MENPVLQKGTVKLFNQSCRSLMAKNLKKAAASMTATADRSLVAYSKLEGNSHFSCHKPSSHFNSQARQSTDQRDSADFHKSSNKAGLDIKNNPLSSADNSGKSNEAEGTRTLSLRIDSPLLHP